MKIPTLLTIFTLATLAFSGCTSLGDGDAAIYGSQGITSNGDLIGTVNGDHIRQEGSSTVLPLAEIWAEDFGQGRGVSIKVGGGGSGKGASGLCAGELDLADMSRQIKSSEVATCKSNGVNPVEWKIAYDALSVVVSSKNSFVKDLTTDQLNKIFRADNFSSTWNQVNPSYPVAPIHLCYPDSDSGTYEYFNEAILHKGNPRTGDGVQQSSDDNVLVNCLASDANAIGYFGLAYLEENRDKIRDVKVGGVAPTPEHVNDGTYQPLSRFIFIYTNGVPENNILTDYLSYVFHPEGGQSWISEVGYVPLDEKTRGEMLAQLGS